MSKGGESMKEGWKMVKLGEVCDICLGLTHTPKYVDKGIPFISVKDISQGELNLNNTKRISEDEFTNMPDGAKPRKGDVLFCRVGTIGKPQVLKLDEPFGIFVSVGFLRTKTNSLNTYLRHWMDSNLFMSQVEKNVQGSTLKNLNTGWLKNFTLPLPPLEEQHRIVSILDASFEKIDALKKNAEENLKNAKALFQQVLAQELQPKEGWSLVQIRDVALLITKGASPKWQGNKYVEEDGILFVTSENVREGYIDISTPKYVDKTFNLKQQRSILYKDDVLVNIVGASIGRSAIFDLDIIDANINQAVALVRLDKTKLIPRLLCLYLNSNLAFEKYNSMKKDTARANLSLENIGDIELYIPKNITEQHRIVRTLDTLSEKCRRLEQVAQQTIRECDALKQSILRQAFSGEL